MQLFKYQLLVTLLKGLRSLKGYFVSWTDILNKSMIKSQIKSHPYWKFPLMSFLWFKIFFVCLLTLCLASVLQLLVFSFLFCRSVFSMNSDWACDTKEKGETQNPSCRCCVFCLSNSHKTCLEKRRWVWMKRRSKISFIVGSTLFPVWSKFIYSGSETNPWVLCDCVTISHDQYIFLMT